MKGERRRREVGSGVGVAGRLAGVVRGLAEVVEDVGEVMRSMVGA